MPSKLGLSSLIAVMMLFVAHFLCAVERFKFQYRAGETYRIVSNVEQNIYSNNRLTSKASFTNLINVKIESVDDTHGTILARYRIVEKFDSGEAIDRVTSEYTVTYKRDHLGRTIIGGDAFLPMVRNVPQFPDKPIKVGDIWVFPGEEVYDFRDVLGIKRPYRFPILVSYEYLGDQKSPYDENNYPAFAIRYPLQHARRVNTPSGTKTVTISGNTKQILLWDRTRGRPHSYEEAYEFGWKIGGKKVTFAGTAMAYIEEITEREAVQIKEEIEKGLAYADVQDVHVEIDDEGVVIRIANLQFAPNSTRFLAGEQERISKITATIAHLPQKQLLIEGHTALAGSEAGQISLSIARANSVAQILRSLGFANLIVQGVGATQPLAPNSTESGRRQNRRVEIKIIGNQQ